MAEKPALHWFEGQFLRPQHLQPPNLLPRRFQVAMR